MAVQATPCMSCFDNFTNVDAGLCGAMNAACGTGTACAATSNCVATGVAASDAGAVLACITSPDASPAYLDLLNCVCFNCQNVSTCQATVSCSATDGGADAAGG